MSLAEAYIEQIQKSLSINMKLDDYLIDVLEVEPFYETEEVFYQPFWDFKYKFQSLQRHWILNSKFNKTHINLMLSFSGDESAEFDTFYSETIGVDIDFFSEYLRLSTISCSLSLLENLLGSLSDEISKDLNLKIELDSRPLPYINKYLLWFIRGCGFELDIDKNLWKELDAIREVRNRFIHKIDRDIPEQVKSVIGKMISDIDSESSIINDEFVNVSLKRVGNLVKNIELSYIKFQSSILVTQK